MISEMAVAWLVSVVTAPQSRRMTVGAEGVAKTSDSVESAATSSGGEAMLTPSESSSG